MKKNHTFKASANNNKIAEQNIKKSLMILNLEDFVNINQLKKQYKKMVKKYHPDLNKSGCNEKIIKLNNAYTSNKFSKKINYDQSYKKRNSRKRKKARYLNFCKKKFKIS